MAKTNGASFNTTAQARAAKAAVSPEIVVDMEHPEVDSPEATSAFERFKAAQDDLLRTLGVPSGTRTICAMVASFVTSAAVSWGLGALLDVITLAAFALTGSSVLGVLIWALGFIVALYLAMKAGMATFNYIANGTIDEHYESIKSGIGSLFSSAKTLFA